LARQHKRLTIYFITVKIILPLLLISLCTLNLANKPARVNGKWTHATDKKVFELKLTQDANSQITGSYCAVLQNGDFIDCAYDDNEKNLKGTINGNTATLTFKSDYCHCTGVATIKWIDDTHIIWKITQYPHGTFHIPTLDTLTKE
jgi:hypothetical protein